jgi:hypothetical protein
MLDAQDGSLRWTRENLPARVAYRAQTRKEPVHGERFSVLPLAGKRLPAQAWPKQQDSPYHSPTAAPIVFWKIRRSSQERPTGRSHRRLFGSPFSPAMLERSRPTPKTPGWSSLTAYFAGAGLYVFVLPAVVKEQAVQNRRIRCLAQGDASFRLTRPRFRGQCIFIQATDSQQRHSIPKGRDNLAHQRCRCRLGSPW